MLEAIHARNMEVFIRNPEILLNEVVNKWFCGSIGANPRSYENFGRESLSELKTQAMD